MEKAKTLWDWLPSEPLQSCEGEWSLTLISARISPEEDFLVQMPPSQREISRDLQTRWAALEIKPTTFEQARDFFGQLFVRQRDLKGNLGSGIRFLYREAGDEKHIFLLLGNDGNLHLEISVCLMFMVTWWYALHGGLLLHAAAVADDDKGLLFLGKGGAGKSTVASSGVSLGKHVLADDIVLLSSNAKDGYAVQYLPRIWPQFTTNPSQRSRLSGIFTLVKDERDYLVSQPALSIARALAKGYFHSHSLHLPLTARQSAFQTIGDISRRVPGYELHFTKSASFWQVIDAEYARRSAS